MALSIVFMISAAGQAFNLDFLDATIMSLHFQAVALLSIGHVLRGFKPEDVKFDVYKGETVTC